MLGQFGARQFLVLDKINILGVYCMYACISMYVRACEYVCGCLQHKTRRLRLLRKKKNNKKREQKDERQKTYIVAKRQSP